MRGTVKLKPARSSLRSMLDASTLRLFILQESIVVKPNELASLLVRPLHVSVYEPDRPVSYLAATLAYGIIEGHPFTDGNRRTGIVNVL
ncbi:hypothetical protein BDZ97DRAFT_1808175 [Flammula alnicola]|nr:hypothetical protein BDZ97DRAFT_1808175 [Flammula alnicola]